MSWPHERWETRSTASPPGSAPASAWGHLAPIPLAFGRALFALLLPSLPLLSPSLAVAADPPAPAQSTQPSADAVALEAFEAASRWCALRALRDTTAALEARAQVAPVLVRVSRAWDDHRLPFLLYWRGVLGTCVGEASGPTDLENFLALSKFDASTRTLRVDAERRLRRARRGRDAGPTAATLGSVVMAVLGGSAVAIGSGLSAQARQEGGELAAGMGGLEGWVQNHQAYEQARVRQGVGFAVLAAGGAVLVVGVITIPLGGTR